MTETDYEYADEGQSETYDEPVVETAEEYGYVEPSTDVPAPDSTVSDQNPGFAEGAHA